MVARVVFFYVSMAAAAAALFYIAGQVFGLF
jgi:hypothetical protein